MNKEHLEILLADVPTAIFKIEVDLGMPKTTLQKALKGQRELPKKWSIKLRDYVDRKGWLGTAKSIEYVPALSATSKENIDKFNSVFKEQFEKDNRPKTLDQLKAICPPELTGLDRSAWISNKRQEYGI